MLTAIFLLTQGYNLLQCECNDFRYSASGNSWRFGGFCQSHENWVITLQCRLRPFHICVDIFSWWHCAVFTIYMPLMPLIDATLYIHCTLICNITWRDNVIYAARAWVTYGRIGFSPPRTLSLLGVAGSLERTMKGSKKPLCRCNSITHNARSKLCLHCAVD